MKALALTTSFAAVLMAIAASPAALAGEKITAGDWTVEVDGPGLVAKVPATGRPGFLKLSCSPWTSSSHSGRDGRFLRKGPASSCRPRHHDAR
jgi:hypothetical protein